MTPGSPRACSATSWPPAPPCAACSAAIRWRPAPTRCCARPPRWSWPATASDRPLSPRGGEGAMSPGKTRHLPLEGIENFRDFGDSPTRHGRRLKKGLLYRSAHHHHATAEDLAIVADIGPTHIIDLRRTLERNR